MPLMAVGQATHQPTEYVKIGTYQTTKNSITTTDKSITHKSAKWYDLRTTITPSRPDDFDHEEDSKMFTHPYVNNLQIQATHIVVDTIYMHKGDSIDLVLPDYKSNIFTENSINSYQRWYNFKTEGTFQINPSEQRPSSWPETRTDLLMPLRSRTPYRFKNGYIGEPLTTNSIMEMRFYFPKDEDNVALNNPDTRDGQDNNEYIVACDVSAYTDFTETFNRQNSANSSFLPSGQGNCYEPTLSHRIIYVIRAIENTDDWRHKFFQSNQSDAYLEEYEINMPDIFIKDSTSNIVALSSGANAYAVPLSDGGQIRDDPKELTWTIDQDNNTAGIILHGSTISGDTRFIKFSYPKKFNEPTFTNVYTVNKPQDGSIPSATIKVTKKIGDKTYNIAKFKLNFLPHSTLLPQTLVEQIENNQDIENTIWKDYKHRTPAYLAENYRLVTELNFDYDPDVAGQYGQPQVYPFPLGWDESSYAFYDGSVFEPSGNKKDYKGNKNKQGANIQVHAPQWGYYALLNDYVENGTRNVWGYGSDVPAPINKLVNSKGKESTYHLFVDASDRTGRVVRIKFDDNPCRGSEIFVSAWVKVANYYGSNADNAAMLLSLMGVNKNDGNPTYTPIYRYQTGQIPGTYYYPGKTNKNVGNIPGFGNNEWMHVYFSFINDTKEGELNFDHYALQIDNYSASTAGGDQYLDDVRIYVMPPHARVEQKNDLCDNHALLRTRIGWERLLSRIGEKEHIQGSSANDGPATEKIKFCFIDSLIYAEKIKKNSSDKAAAVQAAAVHFHLPITKDGKPEFGNKRTVGTFSLSTLFEEKDGNGNPKYNHADDAVNAQSDDNNVRAFSYTDEAGERFLALDLEAELKPYRPYILMLVEATDDKAETDWNAFIPSDNDPCQMRTDFKVESQKALRINGELFTPETEFCAGQVLDFKVELHAEAAPDQADTPQTAIADATYDWFLGSEQEFYTNKKNADNDKLTVHDALMAFRNSDHEELDSWNTTEDLPGKQKGLLQSLVTEKKLILSQPKISIELKGDEEGKFNMVVRLVPHSLGDHSVICADPLPITLNVTGNAPVAKVGFGDVIYPDITDENPDPTYRAVVRIGKKQLEAIHAENSLLRIPLRGIGSGAEDGNGSTRPLTTTEGSPFLYLIDSNDPKVTEVIARQEAFQLTDWPVARIQTFQATPDASRTGDEGEDYMDCYFLPEADKRAEDGLGNVNFREGYRYTLMAQFDQEQDKADTKAADEGDGTGGGNISICRGQLLFDLKVVPEYQKWTGAEDGSGNWNNDANWRRSTGTELKKGDTDAGEYDKEYNEEAELPYGGFVPMDFTHVTLPRGAKAQLYVANTQSGICSDTHPILSLATQQPAGPATGYIEYDLMVKAATGIENVAYDCRTYYTNTAKMIHFEPETEMQNAHFLAYEKVWVEYELQKGQWHALASPLENMVAGDWYTQTDGTQGTEYFKDITFGDQAAGYSRLTPHVYQRSWDNEAKMITLDATQGEKEVAIQGTWSGVFNSVGHSYTKNYGFSVKTLGFTSDKALFRMPKNDTSYSYYSTDGNKQGDAVTVREAGSSLKLLSDRLKQGEASSSFTAGLEDKTGSGYYLVGNPFIAHLSLKEFFKANQGLEKKAYLSPDGETQVVVSDGLSTEAGGTLIAPLQSFFVKKAETAAKAGELTATFTADMQVLAANAPETETLDGPVLRLTAATDDGRQHKAVLAYAPSASAGYAAGEDAELFIDSHLDGLPMLYTVAGTMAASINRTPDLWDIPLGIYGGNRKEVTLRFEGTGLFNGLSLYDARLKSETRITDATRLTVEAGAHGRYFLRAGIPTANGTIAADGGVRIYSVAPGRLTVATTDGELRTVEVYDFSGRPVYLNRMPGSYTLTVDLPQGNYIVKAATSRNGKTEKVRVR